MARAEETARRLAIVCAWEQRIGGRLRSSPLGSDVLVQEVLEAAREGGEVADRVDVLHGVLQALGDQQGLYAYGDHRYTSDRGVHAVGVDRGRPAEPVYFCPTARCTRLWWPQGPVPVPRCTVSGDALCRGRL